MWAADCICVCVCACMCVHVCACVCVCELCTTFTWHHVCMHATCLLHLLLYSHRQDLGDSLAQGERRCVVMQFFPLPVVSSASTLKSTSVKLLVSHLQTPPHPNHIQAARNLWSSVFEPTMPSIRDHLQQCQTPFDIDTKSSSFLKRCLVCGACSILYCAVLCRVVLCCVCTCQFCFI